MLISVLIPILIGAATILQSGINKDIGSKYSLSLAILFNGVILTLLAIGFFAQQNIFSSEPISGFRSFFSEFKWQYLLPGILGFFVITGIPFAISKSSATKVFVLLVTTQTLGSMLWDYFADAKEIGLKQIIGVILALSGILTLTL